MTSQWDAIKHRHSQLTNTLADGTTLDARQRSSLQRELAHLAHVLAKHQDMQDLEQQVIQTEQQIKEITDPEMTELFSEELTMLQQNLQDERNALDKLIVPPGEHDKRSVYLEIRAGAGGQEAALFVADLLKMYTNYALNKNWQVSVENTSLTDLGGYREVILHIKGPHVYGHLKYESGVHRVQRVPATEAAGRVHTSTATVAVLPEAKEVDVSIDPSDLRIDVFRASGAGGQHVNTTDSAVRITHLPTGLVVSCQDDRSQHKNKAKAMKILKARLLAAKVQERTMQMSKLRKEQVGTGMRAEKVRTYNFPQNRVTDHQVNLTLKKLDMVMQGELKEIVHALREREHEMRREQFLSQFS